MFVPYVPPKTIILIYHLLHPFGGSLGFAVAAVLVPRRRKD